MKLPHVVEAHALAALENARDGKDEEKLSGVTLFRSWPATSLNGARRLAGCANAARGRDLLWLVGVDRAEPMARGADLAEAERWIVAVSERFDGIAPRIQAFAVPAGGKRPVVALHIETGRAPFVIRGANSAMETPWFDGSVRSARRLELVQLLSPLQDLPGLEVLEADLNFYKNPHVSAASRATYRWTLDAAVYVLPQAEARLVIPLHRCRGAVRIVDSSFRSEATDVSLTADKHSSAVRLTESAALIEGLGRFFVYCCGSTREPELPWQNPVEFLFDCTPTGASRSATALATLHPAPVTESNQAGHWKL